MIDNKKFITSLLLIIGINILGAAGWWFAFSNILKESKYITSVRSETEVHERHLANIRSLNTFLNNIKNEKEKISSTFLNQKNVVKFVEELEFLSQKAGVDFKMKAIDLPTKPGPKKPVFQFQIKCSFRDFFHYLVLLEDLFYQVQLEKVQFSEVPLASDGQKLPDQRLWQADFELTLLSYSYENTD
jgi:hypothetical protein